MKLVMYGLMAVLALSVLPVSAQVITVTPVSEIAPVGTMDLGETQLSNGWSIVTNRMGWGKLSTFGPALYFSRNQGKNTPIVAGYPEVTVEKDLGRGTFYATCDMWVGGEDTPGHKTPSTVWLGTDTWKGTSLHGRTLGSINQMSYYSFVDKCPTREAAGTEPEWWAKPNWWDGPQQPIQIQLTVTSPDGSEMRQLWYRPWGTNYVGDDGTMEPGSKKGRWQFFNCLTTGKWYKPQMGTTPNTVERGWPSWTEMLNFQEPDGPMPAYRDWKLADPAVIMKSPGWDGQTDPVGDPNSTGTGYPLNFFVGARKTAIYPLFLQDAYIRWYNHMYGERAQIDYFTLGFSLQGSETYNFEPSPNEPDAQTVALSNRALKDPIWKLTDFTYGDDTVSFPYSMPQAKKNFLVKVTGVVGDPPELYNQSFTIEDGSKLTFIDPGYLPNWTPTIKPNPIRVFLPNDLFRSDPWWITAGDIVTVEGYIEGLRFPAGPVGLLDYLIMWTNINNITIHGRG